MCGRNSSTAQLGSSLAPRAGSEMAWWLSSGAEDPRWLQPHLGLVEPCGEGWVQLQYLHMALQHGGLRVDFDVGAQVSQRKCFKGTAGSYETYSYNLALEVPESHFC